jgi:hypothetical protein
MKKLLLAGLLLISGSVNANDAVYQCTVNNVDTAHIVIVADPWGFSTRWGFLAVDPVSKYYGYGSGQWDATGKNFTGQTMSGTQFAFGIAQDNTLHGSMDLVQKGVMRHLAMVCYWI